MSKIKISIGEKIGFSIGEFSSSIVWQSLMFFLPAFYTDTFGLTASSVATMFFVVRLFDAFTDPVMGMVADRTESRWGKFRPYLLFLSLPFGIGTVLLFTTPDLGDVGKSIYAYVTYSFMMVIYTALAIPYNSLVGVVSNDPVERTSFSTYKFIFAYAAGISVQLFIYPLTQKLGNGNTQRGYQLTMLLFAAISVLFLFISFLSVKERVNPDRNIKSDIKSDLKDLYQNKPWLILFFMSLITLIFLAIRSADVIYYFKYFIGNEGASGKFMAIGTACTLLGVLPTNWLSKKYGKRNVYIVCQVLMTVSSFLIIFIKPGDIIELYLLQIVFSLALGPVMPLVWSMLADVADYSEWKNKRRATGLVYSATTFAHKAGFSIGGAFVMFLLGYLGFIANTTQSDLSLTGIRYCLSVIPAIIAFPGIILLFYYKLDDDLIKKIEKDLLIRKDKQIPN